MSFFEGIEERLSEVVDGLGARAGWLEEVVGLDGAPHRGRVFGGEPGVGGRPEPDAPYVSAKASGFCARGVFGFNRVGDVARGWAVFLRTGPRVQARLVLVGLSSRPATLRYERFLDRLHRCLPPRLQLEDEVRLILDANGRLLFGPAEADPHLVERASRRGTEPGRFTVDGAIGTSGRLVGRNGQSASLVTLRSAEPFDLSADLLLTPIQREIALFAAEGATTGEIARSTGRASETVKTHLREIYRRLDVGSRVELSKMVGGRDMLAI